MLFQKNLSKFIFISVASVLGMLGIAVGGGSYINYAARQDATRFCEEITMGETLGLVGARYEKQGGQFQHADNRGLGYTFVFPGFVMDKAYCDIGLDHNGQVISKHSYLQAD
jgi:hypothetical protein